MERKRQKEAAIRRKRVHLKELLIQQISFQNLIERNERLAREAGPAGIDATRSIPLPFIVVNTPSAANIRCSVTDDK